MLIQALSIKNRFDYYLISDVRFENEIDVLKNAGFNVITLRVERIGYKSELNEKQQKHASETSLDNYNFDYYIKTGEGLDKLRIEVEKFICWLMKDNEIRL